MHTRKILMTTASLAVMASVAGPVCGQDVAARKSAASPARFAPASDAGVLPYQSPPRHLIYIATPERQRRRRRPVGRDRARRRS